MILPFADSIDGSLQFVVSKQRSSQTKLSVEAAREILRNAGLRCTPTRLVVLEHVSGVDRPMSHAEISEVLVPLGFEKSTLFRVLVELSDSEIFARIDAGDHAWRFELRRGTPGHASSDHPHFVCNDCGKVECLPDLKVSFRNSAKKSTSKSRKIDEVFLKGTCGECGDATSR